MTAREQARKAVAEALMMGTVAAETRGKRAADAASDVWEAWIKAIKEIAEAPINDFETDKRRLEMILKLAKAALDG